jgi:hypothetical protein
MKGIKLVLLPPFHIHPHFYSFSSQGLGFFFLIPPLRFGFGCGSEERQVVGARWVGDELLGLTLCTFYRDGWSNWGGKGREAGTGEMWFCFWNLICGKMEREILILSPLSPSFVWMSGPTYRPVTASLPTTPALQCTDIGIQLLTSNIGLNIV